MYDPDDWTSFDYCVMGFCFVVWAVAVVVLWSFGLIP